MITDYSVKLPYANWRDSRWNDAQLVFRAPHASNQEVATAYDDRLQEWDYDAWKRGTEAAKASEFGAQTAGWYQELLRTYHDDPALDLLAIWKGCNCSSGYEYHVFAYHQAEVAS